MLYFDHNATTFVAPEVADVFATATRDVFGNASSTHRQGQAARQRLDESRRRLASFFRVAPTEVVLTSGGTEANNLAILGLVRNFTNAPRHVVTAEIEHPSVLEACRQLECEGAEVTYVRPDTNGRVSVADVMASVRPDTLLISMMHANNETGVLQPINDVACAVRAPRTAGRQIFFHSDGVQAAGKIAVNLDELGADLYSVSAHKLFAPKGVGALIVRKGTPLRGIQFGGKHERERRAGTENVPGAMAFSRAVELCSDSDADHVAQLRDRFEVQVCAELPDVEVNGASTARLPNTSNLYIPGVSGEAMVIALDFKGMAVSTGSACSSGSIEPSPVLLAMGRSKDAARQSVRFSFGRYNTPEEVDLLARAVVHAASRLRTSAKKEHDAIAV